MTTPAKLRPGKVAGHAEWVSPRVPRDLRLPDWVESATFRPWLEQALEEYEFAMTNRRLHVRIHEQRRVAVAWLKDALRDLKRGDLHRLRDHPSSPMPGDACAACWMQARMAGLDWDELVGEAAADSERHQLLSDLVEKAIASMEAERASRPPRQKGRKSMAVRDKLLRDVATHLQQYQMPDSELADRWHRPKYGEALRAADDILVGCGVPSSSPEENPKSLARAARRGKL